MATWEQLDLFATSSSEEAPARTSAWLDGVRDWLASGPDSSLNSFASLTRRLPAGFCGRTSLALCPPTAGRTSPASSGPSPATGPRSRASGRGRSRAGGTPGSASAPAGPPPGVCLTLNLSEGVRCTHGSGGSAPCRSAAGGSSLSRVLETWEDWAARHPTKSYADWISYLSKFFLSRTAVTGILRRAEARGRRLPPRLEAVLRRQASTGPGGEGRTTPTS